MSSSLRNQTISTTTALLSITCSTTFAFYCSYRYLRHTNDKAILELGAEWSKKRQEERTGRIRAEVKLRTALKELQQYSNHHEQKSSSKTMVLICIGTVISPYTKRMGTPRQPQLVPASRGYIEISAQPAVLSGIEQYSHIWVIFEFHANTDTEHSRRTKIRPPRGDGVKVGQLATRSPHRPNPLGLSLVKLERWDEKKRHLHISGLDLVHQTPIYDIKPAVPWDVPGYPAYKVPILKVPSWVEQDDEISQVDFTKEAETQLKTAVTAGNLAPLYTEANNGYHGARATVQQILAQDPRSSHKGLKENARGSNGGSYNFIFGKTRISFQVGKEGVRVTEVALVNFDADSYVDGIPLMSEANEK